MRPNGFANFGGSSTSTHGLREFGYLGRRAVVDHARCDWSVHIPRTVGINGLYLNLKGLERDGIVEPGATANELLGN